MKKKKEELELALKREHEPASATHVKDYADPYRLSE
jgi:hypothetical protein